MAECAVNRSEVDAAMDASRTWTTTRTSPTWLAVRAVLAIVFGIIAVIWPHVTILAAS